MKSQGQRTKNKGQQKPFAKKSFGQNFLVDDDYIAKIVAALDPRPGETIIEIGAGRGALTGKLVESGAKIIAVELDRDLIPLLQTEFQNDENFSLIEADALALDFRQLAAENGLAAGEKFKLVANLPYNISTAILQRLLEQRECFSELILMLQREVVERITAAAGTSERGFLSVLVESAAVSEKLFDVPPTAFRPIPKVWSSVLKLEIKPESLFTQLNEGGKMLRQILAAGFAQKRKTILNNLKNAPLAVQEKFIASETAAAVLEQAGIAPQRRAETLTLAEWVKLAATISDFKR